MMVHHQWNKSYASDARTSYNLGTTVTPSLVGASSLEMDVFLHLRLLQLATSFR